MRQTITISNGTTSVEMPKVKNVQVGGSEIAISKQMASGKIVKAVLGIRAKITASWDFVPADTIAAVLALLKAGGFFEVQYPSPSGDAIGVYSIDYPTLGVFAFISGVPVWHNVILTMESQGAMA